MESFTREDLLQQFSIDFKAAGFGTALEAKAAQVATDSLFRRYSGLVYLRRGRKTNSQRDRLLLAAFDGRNQADLALQFGLTVRRVEQIIAADLKRKKVLEGAL